MYICRFLSPFKHLLDSLNRVTYFFKRKPCLWCKRFLNCLEQGCQMVYFQTKNTNMGKFLRPLEWKRLVYSWAIWNKLRLFCTFLRPFGDVDKLAYFPHVGILCQEKSGNTGLERHFFYCLKATTLHIFMHPGGILSLDP
jgi:hypothetical protein